MVLLAENGQLERAASIIEALEGTDTAAAQYGRWLDAAYLDAPSPQDATLMAEEIRRELPRDWFTDTLTRRLATRVDDPALQAEAEASIEARGHALLRRVRGLTGTGVGLFLLALVLLWRLPRSPRGRDRGGRAAAADLARGRRARPLLPRRLRLPAHARGPGPAAPAHARPPRWPWGCWAACR